MVHSFKGSIAFGLVYIPIKLYAAVKQSDISFNLIDKKTKTRVKYKKTCEGCNGKEVTNDNIVKGYEYSDGKYVVFDEKDFEKIKTPKDKTITIDSFIKLTQIDPIYYNRSYYVTPTEAEKAFALLIKVMEKEKVVGIAKSVLGSKETLIVLRPLKGQLILTTLHFHEEIRKNPYENKQIKLTEKEVSLATSVMKAMNQPFKIENYHDEYTKRVKKAIDAKINGKQIIKPKEAPSPKVYDLMDALSKSLKTNKSMVIKKPRENAKSN